MLRKIYFRNIAAVLLVFTLQTDAKTQALPGDSGFVRDGVELPLTEEESSSKTVADTTIQIPREKLFQVPSGEVDRLQKSPEFAYANSAAFAAEQKSKDGRSGKSDSGSTSVIWGWIVGTVICLGILTLVILLLYNLFVSNKFGFWGRKSGREFSGDTYEVPDAIGRNWEQLTAEAEGSGNYRMAIRCRFLGLLEGLNNKELISFAPEIANSIYLRELRKNLPPMEQQDLSALFLRIVHWYEYVWYGEMPVQKEQYDVVKNNIQELSNRTGI